MLTELDKLNQIATRLNAGEAVECAREHMSKIVSIADWVAKQSVHADGIMIYGHDVDYNKVFVKICLKPNWNPFTHTV